MVKIFKKNSVKEFILLFFLYFCKIKYHDALNRQEEHGHHSCFKALESHFVVSTADGDLIAIFIAKSLYRARAHSHLILIAKKMNKKLHYILFLFVALAFAACNEDIEEPEREVEFCVKAVWENGLGNRNTRSLSETILGDGDVITIDHADYPEVINVHCSDGSDFILTKGDGYCVDDSKFLQYTPSKYYNSKNIDDLNFTATAVLDDGYVMTSEATKDSLDYLYHLRFTFHHTKALLRFAFKVSSQYDKIRFIRVTNINLNGSDCALVDKVLTTSNQLIAYAYVDPAVVTTSSENKNKIECTYNIYDKDSATDADLTRKGVVAKNTFTLSSLKDSNGSIEAGYYYDLKVTLNPDYLYVLSEHDNKHITIN